MSTTVRKTSIQGAHVRGGAPSGKSASAKSPSAKVASGPAMQRGKIITADQLDALCKKTRSVATSMATKLATAARDHFASITSQAEKIVAKGEWPTSFVWTVDASVSASDPKVAEIAFKNALEQVGRNHSSYELNVRSVSASEKGGKSALTAQVGLAFKTPAAQERIVAKIHAGRNSILDKAYVNAWTKASLALITSTLTERARSAVAITGNVFEPIVLGRSSYENNRDVVHPAEALGDVKAVGTQDKDSVRDFAARLEQRLKDALEPRGFSVRLNTYSSRHVTVEIERKGARRD